MAASGQPKGLIFFFSLKNYKPFPKNNYLPVGVSSAAPAKEKHVL